MPDADARGCRSNAGTEALKKATCAGELSRMDAAAEPRSISAQCAMINYAGGDRRLGGRLGGKEAMA